MTEFLNARGAFLPAESSVFQRVLASIWPDDNTFPHSTKHLAMGMLLLILLEPFAEQML